MFQLNPWISIIIKLSLVFHQMSRRINGQEAQTFSLVDALVPADKLLGVARQWALDIQGGRKPWVISLYKSDKLGPLEAAKHILNSARLETRRRNPNIVHPLVCIDVIEEGIVSNPRNALWKVICTLPFASGDDIS